MRVCVSVLAEAETLACQAKEAVDLADAAWAQVSHCELDAAEAVAQRSASRFGVRRGEREIQECLALERQLEQREEEQRRQHAELEQSMQRPRLFDEETKWNSTAADYGIALDALGRRLQAAEQRRVDQRAVTELIQKAHAVTVRTFEDEVQAVEQKCSQRLSLCNLEAEACEQERVSWATQEQVWLSELWGGKRPSSPRSLSPTALKKDEQCCLEMVQAGIADLGRLQQQFGRDQKLIGQSTVRLLAELEQERSTRRQLEGDLRKGPMAEQRQKQLEVCKSVAEELSRVRDLIPVEDERAQSLDALGERASVHRGGAQRAGHGGRADMRRRKGC